jgi:hypothetical protein
MAKQVTREQAERKKAQAATLMERIGEDDRADQFDDMSVEEYAEHRGFQLVANPRRKARKTTMAANGPTKAELQETIDSVIETLSEAYTPEASRATLAAAVGEALDILNGDDEDDADEDDDSTLEDGDSDDSSDDDDDSEEEDDDSEDDEDDEEGE